MNRRSKAGMAVLGISLAAGAGSFWYLLRHGLSAREQPTAVETFVARRLRRLSVPHSARETKNPVALTPEVSADARVHFADHCALWHANDRSGKTEIGQNLYPKAPDMRQPGTQNLSDGELFHLSFLNRGGPVLSSG